GVITVWPEEYRPWARTAGLLDARPAPRAILAGPVDAGAARPTTSAALSVVEPLAGAVYLLDPTLRREFQTLSLRATGGATATLAWFVDGTSLGTSQRDDPARWPLEPGTHSFTVRDASGHTASTKVMVR